MSYLDKLYNRALVAASIPGTNEGANKGFWRHQLRDDHGKWMEMGRGSLFDVLDENGNASVKHGIYIGPDLNTPGNGRFLVRNADGTKSVYSVPAHLVRQYKAGISSEELKRQGIETQDGGHIGDNVTKLEAIKLTKENVKPATAEDERLASIVPDKEQQKIIDEARAAHPLANAPAGAEKAATPEERTGVKTASRRMPGARLAPVDKNEFHPINGTKPGRVWINPDGSRYKEPDTSYIFNKNDLKPLNHVPYGSEEYRKKMDAIEEEHKKFNREYTTFTDPDGNIHAIPKGSEKDPKNAVASIIYNPHTKKWETINNTTKDFTESDIKPDARGFLPSIIYGTRLKSINDVKDSADTTDNASPIEDLAKQYRASKESDGSYRVSGTSDSDAFVHIAKDGTAQVETISGNGSSGQNDKSHYEDFKTPEEAFKHAAEVAGQNQDNKEESSSSPIDDAIAKLWNKAVYGDGANLDETLDSINPPDDKGREVPGGRVFKRGPREINLDDYLADKDGKPVGKVVEITPTDKGVKLGIIHNKNGQERRGNLEVANDQLADIFVPSAAPKAPEAPKTPKTKYMSNDQLDELDKLTEQVGDVSSVDPKLAKDLKNLNKRIDNATPIPADEAQAMIDRLNKHIADNAPKEEPKGVKTPESPTFVPKDRPDNGQMISFPKTSEATLREKRLDVIRDESGDLVYPYDPVNGVFRDEPAESDDAILNALLQENPDAVILEDGGILLERAEFADPDGTKRTIESIVRRTNGANYMVSYRITGPDGKQIEYIHGDYRDSFASIYGVANGIQRVSDILKGKIPSDYLRKSRGYRWYKNAFGTGRFEDRMSHFRIDPSKINVTHDSLKKALAKAEASGSAAQAALAKYNLDLLENEFHGDIDLYKKNAAIQTSTFLTMEETVAKYAIGRFRKINHAKGSSLGTVLRSTVPGIYDAIKSGDVRALSDVMKQLSGRLPDFTKDEKSVQHLLDGVRAKAKELFPNANGKSRAQFITEGYKVLRGEGVDLEALRSAPHVSSDQRIVRRNMLVSYDNNEGVVSTGIVRKLVVSNKSDSKPNEYHDYVEVMFKSQDGKVTTKATVRAADLTVIDDTGITPEALKQVTVYVPRIGGDEMLQTRLGNEYLLAQNARTMDRLYTGITQLVDGVKPVVTDPKYYNTDTLAPGDYLYDKQGLPIGQIAGVRDTTSDSGEQGYTFAYTAPDGTVGFLSTKAGETRGPKQDLTKEDGRGSAESDSGFTPNPADFNDVGLNAENIGNSPLDAEATLIDLMENKGYSHPQGNITLVSGLAKLNRARAAYEKDSSEENRKAYKEALTNHQKDLAGAKAEAALFNGLDYTPESIANDGILSADEIAQINAKIHATHKAFKTENPTERQQKRAKLNYESVLSTLSAPENTYSGYTPDGWSPADVQARLDRQAMVDTNMLKKISKAATGDESVVSDALYASMSRQAVVFANSNWSTGDIKTPEYHFISNAAGDSVAVQPNRDGNGYVVKDSDVQTATDVFAALREKLDVGDKPLSYVLMDTSKHDGRAYGFVWTADLFNSSGEYTVAHSVVNSVQRGIDKFSADHKDPYDPTDSWEAVDMRDNPEMLRHYVISHEMGHVMQGEILRRQNKPVTQAAWNNLYGDIARSYYISEYGQSNYNEHFAESFARWELTGQAEGAFLQFLKDAGLVKQ